VATGDERPPKQELLLSQLLIHFNHRIDDVRSLSQLLIHQQPHRRHQMRYLATSKLS
jgi:hypothetical protein